MATDSHSETHWRFRRALPGDEPILLALFEESFGKGVDSEHWRWKLHRPGDPKAESWVGVDNQDRPVFHYGGMWCDVAIGEETRPAVVAVDSFTAPDLRRRGLLTQGASRVHRTWTDAGAAIVFGLPNEQLGSRADATLGSMHIGLHWWVRVLRPVRVVVGLFGRMAGRPANSRTGEGPKTGDVEIPTESEIQDLLGRSRKDGQFRMWNDHRRWLWRFKNSPVWRYEVIAHRRDGRLDALAAIRLIDGNQTAVVSALEMADESAGRALLRAAAGDLKTRGFSTLRALAPAASPLEHTLKRAGLLVPRHKFRLHIKARATDLPLHALRRSERWHLNAGDFDVG